MKRQVEHTPTAFNGTVYTDAVQWQCMLIHCNTRQINFSKNTPIVMVCQQNFQSYLPTVPRSFALLRQKTLRPLKNCLVGADSRYFYFLFSFENDKK